MNFEHFWKTASEDTLITIITMTTNIPVKRNLLCWFRPNFSFTWPRNFGSSRLVTSLLLARSNSCHYSTVLTMWMLFLSWEWCGSKLAWSKAIHVGVKILFRGSLSARNIARVWYSILGWFHYNFLSYFQLIPLILLEVIEIRFFSPLL
jgi:hypothetical protein